MPRAPFQVLVLPYIIKNKIIDYCIFQRQDSLYWQGIAGGGEDNETPEKTAARESKEEANIYSSDIIKLQTMSYIPASNFRDSNLWGKDLYVIPEYCFGFRGENKNIFISHEHIGFKWCAYDEALHLLKYDGNRTALWELNLKLQGKGPRD